MSFLQHLRSSAINASDVARRQTSRVMLELRASRVENDIRKQKTKIGEALYPLLVKNELETGNSSVARALKRIEILLEQLSEIEREIENLLKKEN
ncbi:uncharacterized protein METZ01_LOCUS388438 [marine metagenome]|uniref:Uncharacterized protein n=1 Tax=marine metagenome TaxID=408172 RepID=A0A382UMT2_9ZZZZ